MGADVVIGSENSFWHEHQPQMAAANISEFGAKLEANISPPPELFILTLRNQKK
jgi:hypothetical protein